MTYHPVLFGFWSNDYLKNNTGVNSRDLIANDNNKSSQ